MLHTAAAIVPHKPCDVREGIFNPVVSARKRYEDAAPRAPLVLDGERDENPMMSRHSLPHFELSGPSMGDHISDNNYGKLAARMQTSRLSYCSLNVPHASIRHDGAQRVRFGRRR
jgi:hypothetical protein